MNWRGRPLTSHEVVVKTIAATRTCSGLRVEAALDPGDFPTGLAISEQQLDALPIQPHAVHGAWNYTIHPQPAADTGQAAGGGAPDSPAQHRLTVALAPLQACSTRGWRCASRCGTAWSSWSDGALTWAANADKHGRRPC
jgi:Rhodopirellula transposase DDE domain